MELRSSQQQLNGRALCQNRRMLKDKKDKVHPNPMPGGEHVRLV